MRLDRFRCLLLARGVGVSPVPGGAEGPGSCNGLSTGRVVFSVTTIPERLPYIKPMIDSLIRQSYKLDKIHITVGPAITNDKLPDWFQEFDEQVNVNHMSIDYGPVMKLLGALEEEENGNTLIIYGDDDVVYGKDLVRDHVRAHEFDAQLRKDKVAYGSRRLGKGSSLDPYIIEAVGSVSAKRAYFDKKQVDQIRFSIPQCVYADDVFISELLRFGGIELETLPGYWYDYKNERWPSTWGFSDLENVKNIKAVKEADILDDEVLRDKAHNAEKQTPELLEERYQRCVEYMRAQYQHSFFNRLRARFDQFEFVLKEDASKLFSVAGRRRRNKYHVAPRPAKNSKEKPWEKNSEKSSHEPERPM